jgi:hypothetical protein
MTSAALVMVGCENRKPLDDEPSDVIEAVDDSVWRRYVPTKIGAFSMASGPR